MRSLGKSALAAALLQSRQYTKSLVDDLSDAEWNVPQLPTINPILWETGHVGWFMERWCLRAGGVTPSLLEDADRWYDSSAVAHAERWTLPLPSRAATVAYLGDVLALTLEALEHADGSDDSLYVFRLALAHEDMHAESFAWTRQTLGYAAPSLASPRSGEAGELRCDGGEFEQGMPRAGSGFVFDNEKWAHPVHLAPYAIARSPLTAGEFTAFVDDGGYRNPHWWSEAGRAWLAMTGAAHPRYWRRVDHEWQQRAFDRWQPLDSAAPLMHVTAHEAEAYCRWAGCRLPTETEWEFAAVTDGIDWGGSVWEWTASDFTPYPGFVADAYRDYSEPWFDTHRSVRGGSFVTPQRLEHARFRNFFMPERCDIFVGFRTCRTLA